MQKTIKIKTKDGFQIYGDMLSASKPSNKLVIFCHGFTGNRNEHIFFNGAQYFTKKGFDTLRLGFYSDEKGARHFENTKISQHGQDITTVVNHFSKKYKKIYLVGHSFGGTSLLFTDPSKVSAMVFWDATYIDVVGEKKFWPHKKDRGGYNIDWGISTIVGKDFVEELLNFPDCGELVKKIHTPVKFIGIGNTNTSPAKKYFTKANEPKSLAVIKEADHCFNSPKTEQQLFEETYDWVKKY